MKTHIKYKNTPSMQWWSWYETCDRCKAHIHGMEFLSSVHPHLDEVDLCTTCLRYLLDHHIKYDKDNKTDI